MYSGVIAADASPRCSYFVCLYPRGTNTVFIFWFISSVSPEFSLAPSQILMDESNTSYILRNIFRKLKLKRTERNSEWTQLLSENSATKFDRNRYSNRTHACTIIFTLHLRILKIIPLTKIEYIIKLLFVYYLVKIYRTNYIYNTSFYFSFQ